MIRLWVTSVARYYRLDHVRIDRLRPFERAKAFELAWIDKFVDLIERGSEPPPIICDAYTGQIMNGSVRTHALRELGRETVHAWVADHDYKPSEVSGG